MVQGAGGEDVNGRPQFAGRVLREIADANLISNGHFVPERKNRVQISALWCFFIFHRDQVVTAQILLQGERFFIQVHTNPNALFERHFFVFVNTGERANDLYLGFMNVGEL